MAEKPRGRAETEVEGTGKREARARVPAEEATPPVDLRSEKAGLAAAEAMRIKEDKKDEEMRNRESDSQCC